MLLSIFFYKFEHAPVFRFNGRKPCFGQIVIMGSRSPPVFTNKKPYPGGNQDTANAKKTVTKQACSALSSYHSFLQETSSKGSSLYILF